MWLSKGNNIPLTAFSLHLWFSGLKIQKKLLITGVCPKKETDYQPKMRCKCSLGNSLSQGFVTRELKNHFTVFSCASQWSSRILQRFRFSSYKQIYSTLNFWIVPLGLLKFLFHMKPSTVIRISMTTGKFPKLIIFQRSRLLSRALGMKVRCRTLHTVLRRMTHTLNIAEVPHISSGHTPGIK